MAPASIWASVIFVVYSFRKQVGRHSVTWGRFYGPEFTDKISYGRVQYIK
jgi:hypothetical protein